MAGRSMHRNAAHSSVPQKGVQNWAKRPVWGKGSSDEGTKEERVARVIAAIHVLRFLYCTHTHIVFDYETANQIVIDDYDINANIGKKKYS